MVAAGGGKGSDVGRGLNEEAVGRQGLREQVGEPETQRGVQRADEEHVGGILNAVAAVGADSLLSGVPQPAADLFGAPVRPGVQLRKRLSGLPPPHCVQVGLALPKHGGRPPRCAHRAQAGWRRPSPPPPGAAPAGAANVPELAQANRRWLVQVQLHADRHKTGRQLGSPGLLCQGVGAICELHAGQQHLLQQAAGPLIPRLVPEFGALPAAASAAAADICSLRKEDRIGVLCRTPSRWRR